MSVFELLDSNFYPKKETIYLPGKTCKLTT